MSDYIKLHRSMMEWEWYKNANTMRIFVHMLFKANWKDGKFEGKDIPRGSFVSSLDKLAEETNLSKDKVRTAVKHLIFTNEITTQKFPKYTVFAIKNYNRFQDVPTQNTTQTPCSSHAVPTQFPAIEEKKEGKKERNNNIYTHAYEEFWTAYPRKKDKGNAFKKFNARLVNGFSEVELIGAAKKYAKECEENQISEKYIKYPATFLSDKLPFLDYLEKQKPKTEPDPQEEDEELVGDDW